MNFDQLCAIVFKINEMDHLCCVPSTYFMFPISFLMYNYCHWCVCIRELTVVVVVCSVVRWTIMCIEVNFFLFFLPPCELWCV